MWILTSHEHRLSRWKFYRFLGGRKVVSLSRAFWCLWKFRESEWAWWQLTWGLIWLWLILRHRPRWHWVSLWRWPVIGYSSFPVFNPWFNCSISFFLNYSWCNRSSWLGRPWTNRVRLWRLVYCFLLIVWAIRWIWGILLWCFTWRASSNRSCYLCWRSWSERCVITSSPCRASNCRICPFDQ